MPEGDVVWRTANRLNRALAGAPVTMCDLRFPQIATADLRGTSTVEVASRGKHILHRFDNGVTLHSHLKMEGQWRIESPQQQAPWLRRTDLRAAIGTSTWTGLGLRLGLLELVPTASESTIVGHLGPDVLGADWDPALAAANIAASATTIGGALLDQRNLAGVGTMYAAETLFVLGQHPWTLTGELSSDRISEIVQQAWRFLDDGRHHAIQAPTGARRRGEEMFVHARSGRPCRACGGGIRVAMIGPGGRERTMFYCPRCQGGLGPTDDGRPQRPLGSSRGRHR